MRVLEVMKANYGPVGETITLRWQNGLFLPQAAMGTFDKMAAEQAADSLFLKLLDKFQAQGRNVSHHKSANGYAQQRSPLFDHLVGAHQYRRWNCDADRSRSLKIHGELERGWLFDR